MVTRTEVTVDGAPASVWAGGSGEALLLLHGGWGGARLHWAPVWDRLAERFRVVAPDLLGLADERPALGGFSAYATWLERLLDATGSAGGAGVVVGNSFGAALAARLASQAPARCSGLVLVNGGPAPALPAPVRRLLGTGPLRRLVTAAFRRDAYVPSTASRAFADPARAPAELVGVLAQKRPRQLEVVTDVILADDEALPPPRVRTLVLWGARDRLLGGKPAAAQRLRRSLPDAELSLVPGAGHLPQLEQPDAFVDALVRFAAGAGPGAARA